MQISACAGWDNAETILSQTESTRNILTHNKSMLIKFSLMLSQRSNLNFFHRQSKRINFIVDRVNIERISMVIEWTRNEFYRKLSHQGTNFITDWVNMEPFLSETELTEKCKIQKPTSQDRLKALTASSQLVWARSQASLSSLLRPSSHSQLVANYIWATFYVQLAFLSSYLAILSSIKRPTTQFLLIARHICAPNSVQQAILNS